MADDENPVDQEYWDFARKMTLFEDGPETTNFAQLTSAGIQLPEPETVPDRQIGTKLWEVIAALAELRVYLNQTDHLSDRALYATLWHDTLRTRVPAIDEIGFNSHVNLLSLASEADTRLYLRHYAEHDEREEFKKEYPDYELPAPEPLPFNRDWLLPQPPDAPGPDAREWLRAHWGAHAFASNRFPTTSAALAFVGQLYAAHAENVTIHGVLMLPNHDWTPYADTLIVALPNDARRRRELFELMEEVGRPDEDADGPLMDCGQRSVRLWWD